MLPEIGGFISHGGLRLCELDGDEAEQVLMAAEIAMELSFRV
jgi:L-serine deaminase